VLDRPNPAPHDVAVDGHHREWLGGTILIVLAMALTASVVLGLSRFF
jgi:hypothetical protein